MERSRLYGRFLREIYKHLKSSWKRLRISLSPSVLQPVFNTFHEPSSIFISPSCSSAFWLENRHTFQCTSWLSPQCLWHQWAGFSTDCPLDSTAKHGQSMQEVFMSLLCFSVSWNARWVFISQAGSQCLTRMAEDSSFVWREVKYSGTRVVSQKLSRGSAVSERREYRADFRAGLRWDLRHECKLQRQRQKEQRWVFSVNDWYTQGKTY